MINGLYKSLPASYELGMDRIRSFFSSAPKALVLLATLAIATPIALGPMVDSGKAIAQMSGLDRLLERSPGKRDDKKLSPVKGVVSPNESEDAPTQKALGKTFRVPPEIDVANLESETFESALSSVSIVPLDEIATGPLEQPSNSLAASNLPGLGASSLIIAPIASGGGGGLGGAPGIQNPGTGSNDNPASPPEVVVPSAVPEPATWILFFAGIGFVGFAMRRRRRISHSGFAA